MILYGARTTDKGYTVTKFDFDNDTITPYELVADMKVGYKCNCPAFQPRCRHVKMLEQFRAADAFNTGKFLNYEDGTWHGPQSDFDHEEEDQ